MAELHFKEACEDAAREEAAVRAAACEAGIELRVSILQGTKGGASYHWMFEDAAGNRVLNYWPATGSIHSPHYRDLKGKKVKDWWAALDLAKSLLGLRDA